MHFRQNGNTRELGRNKSCGLSVLSFNGIAEANRVGDKRPNALTYQEGESMLELLSPPDAQRLRDFLREAQYTQEEFQSKPELELPSRGSGNLSYLLDRLGALSLANLVLRWFFLGVAAESETAVGLVPEPVLALLLESGFWSGTGTALRPAVMLTPCDQYVFAADTAARLESHAANLVVWPNPTSQMLAHFTMRRPVRCHIGPGRGLRHTSRARGKS